MLPKTDEAQKRMQQYLKQNPLPAEVKPIPKDEKKVVIKKDDKPDWKDKKSDASNEYEYSDNKDDDDKNW